MTEKDWNSHQLAILDDAETGTGDTLVIARAGTGKTTTLLAAAARFPRGCSVAYLAFNTRMKDEVAAKAPKGVEVRTIHSLGRGALYVYARGQGRDLPDPCEGKTLASVARLFPNLFETVRGRLVPRAADRELAASLSAATGYAKNTLARTTSDVREIVSRLVLDVGVSEGDPGFDRAVAYFCDSVLRVLEEEARRFREHLEYNFDDMIWLPVCLDLRTKSYDRLIVDEGQDLNACQHALVRRAMRRGGRIVLVGDDRQAIYGWRGAMEDGLARFQKDLGARVLRLPVTYRCGRAIVALARTLVPDYEAAATNGAGVVEACRERAMVIGAQPGDAILSRVNAPLLKTCLELLKAGKRARVVGRDVGRKISDLVSDAARAGAETVPDLVRWVEAWRRAELDRVEARDGNPDPTNDRADCVLALSEGASSVEEVGRRVSDLFTDDPGRAEIVLSSTHKAKGLEWPVVWCLQDTYRPGQAVEEGNLYYVAITRAIERLVLVSATAPVVEDPASEEPVVEPVVEDVAGARPETREVVEAGAMSPVAEALLRGSKVECWIPGPHETEATSWRVVA